MADENTSLEITENGNILESHDKVLSLVGSVSPFTMAAARVLQEAEVMSTEGGCV